MQLNIFTSLNRDIMTNAKKHKTKSKNGNFINNMYCAIVMGI